VSRRSVCAGGRDRDRTCDFCRVKANQGSFQPGPTYRRTSAGGTAMDRERPWLSAVPRSSVAPMWPRPDYLVVRFRLVTDACDASSLRSQTSGPGWRRMAHAARAVAPAGPASGPSRGACPSASSLRTVVWPGPARAPFPATSSPIGRSRLPAEASLADRGRMATAKG
jgi:hypothetical protein